MEYDSTVNIGNNYKFDINPRSGFDDSVPIEPISYSDVEVMGYKP
jgi:hypothetical protein